MAIPSGEWSLVAWVMNNTHNVRYINGVGNDPQLKTPVNLPATINNELYISDRNRFHSSNFSVGPIRIWAGRLSPVYMWRLFQEGLPDQNENWSWTLQWRHNRCDGISNHQHQDYLLGRLFRRKSKKKIKAPRHWPLGGKFTSNRENVSNWWRHHEMRGWI